VSLASVSIRRPVLTWVLSAFVLLLGAVGLSQLGVREIPAIDPPLITVVTTYAGANAEVCENQITEPLESSLNGIDGVRSIVSESGDGQVTITVEFDLGANLEKAANDVRDRVSRAQRSLPSGVDAPVVSKADANAQPIVLLTLRSPSRDLLSLSDQAARIQERLQTIAGVAEVDLWGERKYAMRLQFDPERMSSLGVTLQDVQTALAAENAELPTGSIEGKVLSVALLSRTGLRTPEDFKRMTVRAQGGKVVRLADIAKVRLGAENERTLLRMHGTPLVGLAILPQPGANQVAISDEVNQRLAKLRPDLAQDLVLETTLDNTRFVRQALSEVQETILIAFALVVAVIFLFLRDFRTTFIPVLAVPISLVGVFFLAWLLGYSINVLTLLGVVLAIGLVVDDAIVVLENIYAKIEDGLPPLEAARIGLEEIFAAVVSTTLVLAAVFTPLLFLSGFTGRLFREFGTVIAGSVLISGGVALTLTGMLASRLLRPHTQANRLHAATEPFFVGLTDRYRAALSVFLKRRLLALPILVVTVLVMVAAYLALPRELSPLEDRSRLEIQVTAHEGATFGATDAALTAMSKALRERIPEIESDLVLTGADASKTNTGSITLALVPADKRTRTQGELAQLAQRIVDSVGGARSLVVQEPSISSSTRTELPLQFVLQAPDLSTLRQNLSKLEDEARRDSSFSQLDVDLKFTKPQLELEVDRDRIRGLGITPMDLAQTLQLCLSESKWGTFQRGERQYDIIGQLDSAHRSSPEGLQLLGLRDLQGRMLPAASLFKSRETSVPPSLYRTDRWVSATVSAAPAEGVPLGEAIARLDAKAKAILPASMRTSLRGGARDYAESSSNLMTVFLLSLVIVYLILAAQFESFLEPVVILVTVPLALAGALLSLWVFGQSLNIYSQIGLVMLVGLVTKNGILIVEFAGQRRDGGLPPLEAVLEASAARLRPILMTTLCTVLGTLPIALALGAGADSRRSLGIAVIGGLLVSLALTLFVVPAVYATVVHRPAKDPS